MGIFVIRTNPGGWPGLICKVEVSNERYLYIGRVRVMMMATHATFFYSGNTAGFGSANTFGPDLEPDRSLEAGAISGSGI